MTVVLYRLMLVYRRQWYIIASGLLEPIFYLLSIGIGVGHLISGFTWHGHEIGYADFVAPAMLATSAMNGAMMDATFNFFHRLRFDKLYDQQLATPLTTMDIASGEIAWTQIRSGIYCLAFLVVMTVLGYVHSWWALAAIPGTLLAGVAFGAFTMACTSYARRWQDLEYIVGAMVPLQFFSGTFFPVTRYPEWLRWVVECTPLYRVVAMCRELTTGTPGWATLASVVYLLVMAVAGLLVVRNRLDKLLLT